MGLFAVAFALAAAPTGVWHASVLNSDDQPVEFRFELSESKGQWTGALINGSDRILSNAGRFDGRIMHLEFRDWDGVLRAEVNGDVMDGTFIRTWRKTKVTRIFRAQRRPFARPAAAPGGDIGGEWILEVDDKTKSIYRASFEQSGIDLRGVLIPVTGDSGELTGTIAAGRLKLGRFDGIRTMLLEAHLEPDGTLEGQLNFNTVTWKLTGRRAGSGAGPDATAYTRMKNPAEPFRFSAPDLEGKLVSSADDRFRDKVVIVTITGSWCPNCHEEAPLLNELYRRYHARGLEIVALAFEYTGDVERDRAQLRLFRQKHGIAYPILLAGTTEEAEAKLGQLANFGAYPTTLFIGRDGLVRSIHAGFDGPSTGARHDRLRSEITKQVEEMLQPMR